MTEDQAGSEGSGDKVFDAQRHVWTIGDYPAIARRLHPISVELVGRLGITAGESVLDVATGDGNAAILAAQRGARVSGVDLTPAQIERARARCTQSGVDVDLAVGNAEDLDAPEFTYDVVMSVMGMIFAPHHRKAAAEMVRVTKPGGRVGMTSWAPSGFFARWRERVEDFLPPAGPGEPDPDGWSDPVVVRERFAAVGLEMQVEVAPFTWEFDSLVEAAEFYTSNAGPFILFMEAATANGFGNEAKAMLLEVIDDANQAMGGKVLLQAPYTVAVGTR